MSSRHTLYCYHENKIQEYCDNIIKNYNSDSAKAYMLKVTESSFNIINLVDAVIESIKNDCNVYNLINSLFFPDSQIYRYAVKSNSLKLVSETGETAEPRENYDDIILLTVQAAIADLYYDKKQTLENLNHYKKIVEDDESLIYDLFSQYKNIFSETEITITELDSFFEKKA